MGRTGTLISIDIALAQAAREGIVNIPAIVTKMRTERMKMVQSPVRNDTISSYITTYSYLAWWPVGINTSYRYSIIMLHLALLIYIVMAYVQYILLI